jgi:hypothetical protein
MVCRIHELGQSSDIGHWHLTTLSLRTDEVISLLPAKLRNLSTVHLPHAEFGWNKCVKQTRRTEVQLLLKIAFRCH